MGKCHAITGPRTGRGAAWTPALPRGPCIPRSGPCCGSPRAPEPEAHTVGAHLRERGARRWARRWAVPGRRPGFQQGLLHSQMACARGQQGVAPKLDRGQRRVQRRSEVSMNKA